MMRPSLFRSGVAPRLGAAAVFGVLAFGAVAMLESSRGGHADGAAPPAAAAVPAASTRATLSIQSLRPVARWEVRLDGAPLAPRREGPTSWSAEFESNPQAALVVDAVPATEFPAEPNALRIRIANTAASHDQTFWCDGAWSLATRVGQLARTAAPIDPTDLP